VLIVEDDAGVRGALQRGLDRDGFDTTAVDSAATALNTHGHDIALVDLGLPDGDGIELCRHLRAVRPTTPIIVVTGRRDELDVVDALDSGVDDYVTKPFSLAVLSARIRRHLDRCSTTIAVGGLRIDRLARRVTVADEPLELAPREFDLLVALAVRASEVVSHDELIETVWDAHWSKSTHTLAVHVSALRSKLQDVPGAPTISAVAGRGYRLEGARSNR
jgi:DNA-binding response OmpR family regulator